MKATELLEMIAIQRKERCRMIILSPAKFKLCEGCESILFDANLFCPYCHAYRFNHDPIAVVQSAVALSDKPLATGCAYLPRQTTVKGLSFA